MRTKTKLYFGAPLIIIGALALILIPVLGFSNINSLIKLILLSFFGVLVGLGIALFISGLIDLKLERNEDNI